LRADFGRYLSEVDFIEGNAAITKAYWPTWVEAAKRNPEASRLVVRYTRRPAEELYHTADDPFEGVNLAADPASQATKGRLAAALDRWLHAARTSANSYEKPANRESHEGR
jgi:hypothetical protein